MLDTRLARPPAQDGRAVVDQGGELDGRGAVVGDVGADAADFLDEAFESADLAGDASADLSTSAAVHERDVAEFVVEPLRGGVFLTQVGDDPSDQRQRAVRLVGGEEPAGGRGVVLLEVHGHAVGRCVGSAGGCGRFHGQSFCREERRAVDGGRSTA